MRLTEPRRTILGRAGSTHIPMYKDVQVLRTQDAQEQPPHIGLPRLLSAAERVAGDADSDEDLRLLWRSAQGINPGPGWASRDRQVSPQG